MTGGRDAHSPYFRVFRNVLMPWNVEQKRRWKEGKRTAMWPHRENETSAGISLAHMGRESPPILIVYRLDFCPDKPDLISSFFWKLQFSGRAWKKRGMRVKLRSKETTFINMLLEIHSCFISHHLQELSVSGDGTRARREGPLKGERLRPWLGALERLAAAYPDAYAVCCAKGERHLGFQKALPSFSQKHFEGVALKAAIGDSLSPNLLCNSGVSGKRDKWVSCHHGHRERRTLTKVGNRNNELLCWEMYEIGRGTKMACNWGFRSHLEYTEWWEYEISTATQKFLNILLPARSGNFAIGWWWRNG